MAPTFFQQLGAAYPGLARGYRRFVAASLHYTGQLQQSAEQQFASGDPSWCILRYQQVIDPEALFFPPSVRRFVRPQTFVQHMRFVARQYRVVPLMELLEQVERGDKIPPFTVALTFDGGWLDFYLNAWPVVKQLNLPATVFLPTTFIGTNNLPWRDKILGCIVLLDNINQPFPIMDFLPADTQNLLREMEDTHSMLERCSVLVTVLQNSTDLRSKALLYLGTMIDELGGFPIQKLHLTWDHVREMQQSGITFGTMGHNHRDFTELSREEMADEIAASARMFSDERISPIPVLSFPEGQVPNGARKLLKDIGLTHALIDDLRKFSPQKDGVFVHPRVPVFQAAAGSIDLLACRMWRLRSLGVSFEDY